MLNLTHEPWFDGLGALGDAGLTALAPALRRQPALENLSLLYNPLGDKGLAALVAPKTILPPCRLGLGLGQG